MNEINEIIRMNGQCSDCYWAFRSLLEFYFCNCHKRYEEYVKKYRASEAPRGGIPQSSNFCCKHYEFTHGPIPTKLYAMMKSKGDVPVK